MEFHWESRHRFVLHESTRRALFFHVIANVLLNVIFGKLSKGVLSERCIAVPGYSLFFPAQGIVLQTAWTESHQPKRTVKSTLCWVGPRGAVPNSPPTSEAASPQRWLRPDRWTPHRSSWAYSHRPSYRRGTEWSKSSRFSILDFLVRRGPPSIRTCCKDDIWNIAYSIRKCSIRSVLL